MTKKDIALIASILFEAKPIAPDSSERGRQWINTVNCFSEKLAQEHSQFSLGRFERMCENGVE